MKKHILIIGLAGIVLAGVAASVPHKHSTIILSATQTYRYSLYDTTNWQFAWKQTFQVDAVSPIQMAPGFYESLNPQVFTNQVMDLNVVLNSLQDQGYEITQQQASQGQFGPVSVVITLVK